VCVCVRVCACVCACLMRRPETGMEKYLSDEREGEDNKIA
jgi:hypothetical protein